MADRGPLGEAGGTARVEDEEDVLGIEAGRGGRGRGGGRRLRIRPAREERTVQPLPPPGVLAPTASAVHFVEQRGEAVRDQHHLRLDERDAVPQLARGEPPVLAGENGSDAGGGQHESDVGRAVLGEERDPVSALYPVRGEPPGNPVCQVVQLPVRERALPFHDRHPSGPGPGHGPERAVDGGAARGCDERFRRAGVHGQREVQLSDSRAEV